MIRLARQEELAELSELCLRSKAYWGYEKSFLEACREELTLTPADLGTGLAVWEECGEILGIVQVKPLGAPEEGVADLALLFVDPKAARKGIGTGLFLWAVDVAAGNGASTMMVESDPNAAAFYAQMGARHIGFAASGSIPGRELPLFEFSLAGVLDPVGSSHHP